MQGKEIYALLLKAMSHKYPATSMGRDEQFDFISRPTTFAFWSNKVHWLTALEFAPVRNYGLSRN